MRPSQAFWRRSAALLAWAAFALIAPAAVAQIQVTSTSPNTATQGTLNLSVTVNGKGFKRGAQAAWFATGTTNPGGVTVNSTAFVSSTQLTANITVSDTAVIGNFDVMVTNTSDGRTGKGTELFSVAAKVNPSACTTTGTPSGFSLVATLNPVQSNGAALITSLTLGNAARVRPVDLNGDSVPDSLALLVSSGTQGTEGTYLFMLDPATGQLQTVNPVTSSAWTNPVQVLSGVPSAEMAVGDVNGDGIPDFLLGSRSVNKATLLVGAVSANTLSYTAYTISAPKSAGYFGWGVALGDLDGDGLDELAIGAPGGSKGTTAQVDVYKYLAASHAITPLKTFTANGGGFGQAVAIGYVDGNASHSNNLVVGAPFANSTGAVYVYITPVLTQTSSFTLAGSGSNFGLRLGIRDVDLVGSGIPDLVITTGAAALIYAGPVISGASFSSQLFPANGLTQEWAQPGFEASQLSLSDGTIVGAVAVAAPGAANESSCNAKVGAVHLFTGPFGSSQTTSYLFEPPTVDGSNDLHYGYSVAMAPGYPFVIIGESYRNVGTTAGAGQVYVYKKN